MELQKKQIRETVHEIFSSFTGLNEFNDETEIFGKNNAFFFIKVCIALDCRIKYNSSLRTLGEYVDFFISAIECKKEKKRKFVQELQEFVKECTGNFYEPDDILFNEILPVAKENSCQYVREQMAYWNKLGSFKNQLRKKYAISWDSEAFFSAKTINNFANALFMTQYRED